MRVGGAVGNGGFKIARVGRIAFGDTEVSAFFVHEGRDLGSGHALLVHYVGDDGGVDVAAPGAHKHAGKRGEAH